MRALLLSAAVACLAASSYARELRVISVSGGSLALLREKPRSPRTLAPGRLIPAGGTVRLSAGTAVLALGDEGKLLLKGPAIFRSEAGEGAAAELLSGGLLNVLPRLMGSFRLRVGPIVAAVRGTDFYAEARPGGQAYVCRCSGTLDFKS